MDKREMMYNQATSLDEFCDPEVFAEACEPLRYLPAESKKALCDALSAVVAYDRSHI